MTLNTASGKAGFATLLDVLQDELPNCDATSLVVSWFGDDLHCGDCSLQPKVEQTDVDGREMSWRFAGLIRTAAPLAPPDGNGKLIYGGAPADQSVREALTALADARRAATFYPFILMDQATDNGKIDPGRWRMASRSCPGAGASPCRWRQASTDRLIKA